MVGVRLLYQTNVKIPEVSMDYTRGVEAALGDLGVKQATLSEYAETLEYSPTFNVRGLDTRGNSAIPAGRQRSAIDNLEEIVRRKYLRRAPNTAGGLLQGLADARRHDPITADGLQEISIGNRRQGILSQLQSKGIWDDILRALTGHSGDRYSDIVRLSYGQRPEINLSSPNAAALLHEFGHAVDARTNPVLFPELHTPPPPPPPPPPPAPEPTLKGWLKWLTADRPPTPPPPPIPTPEQRQKLTLDRETSATNHAISVMGAQDPHLMATNGSYFESAANAPASSGAQLNPTVENAVTQRLNAANRHASNVTAAANRAQARPEGQRTLLERLRQSSEARVTRFENDKRLLQNPVMAPGLQAPAPAFTPSPAAVSRLDTHFGPGSGQVAYGQREATRVRNLMNEPPRVAGARTRLGVPPATPTLRK